MKHSVLAFLVAAFAMLGVAHAGADAITLYPAYGDVRGYVIEGRIVERREAEPAHEGDGKLRNLVRNARLFSNDERQHQPVSISLAGREWQATTDNEGYFRIEIGDMVLPPGWHAVQAHSGSATAAGELLIVAPGATRGLISDLDDTILVSEVTSKRRLLRNTFLMNSAQRQPVAGTARLYAGLVATGGETTPLFYLSASPRQLHGTIASFLLRNDFPHGVLITKRVTNDRSSEPLTDQFAYKTAKIEEIFMRLPGVRFVLVGDDGERDPEIYDWVRQQHPERVEAIWIRRVHPDPARARPEGQRDLAEVLTINEGVQLQ
jgi:phosphatidate phosphatase APP1